VRKTYSERIESLHGVTKIRNTVKALPKFYNEDEGFYKSISSSDGVKELSDFVSKFANRFEIGKHLSARKWGKSRVARIQHSLFGYMKKILDKDNISKKPASTVSIYRDLKSKVTDPDKQFTASDFAVVAKTEAANIKAVTQLLMWQKAGIIYVKYKTRNDSKVGLDHRKLNNKEFKIDYLLKNADKRIPTRPNCRCHYIASYKGLK